MIDGCPDAGQDFEDDEDWDDDDWDDDEWDDDEANDDAEASETTKAG